MDPRQTLHFLPSDLVEDILENSEIADVPMGTEILRIGQYVKVIPVVLEGLVKVFSRFQDKELLLYYIRPNESCVMSFSAGIEDQVSKVFALTEEDSKILLIPVSKISAWIGAYPSFSDLFYRQYNLRYSELLDTINHVLFNKMDKRLYDYLLEKKSVKNQNPLTISHRQIAEELGTAREVISRVMKKLENDGLVVQHTNAIQIT